MKVEVLPPPPDADALKLTLTEAEADFLYVLLGSRTMSADREIGVEWEVGYRMYKKLGEVWTAPKHK